MPPLRRSTRLRRPVSGGADPESEPEEEVTVLALMPKSRKPRRNASAARAAVEGSENDAERADSEGARAPGDEDAGSEAAGGEDEEGEEESEVEGGEYQEEGDEEGGDEDEDGSASSEDQDEDEESSAESDVSAEIRVRKTEEKTGKADVDPNEIEPYPFSKKTTRAYEGPFKRQRKTPHIFQYMYGPDEAHTMLAYNMLNRWYGLDTLPERPTDDDSTIPIRTPWLPPGFEASQQQAWSEWIERYRKDENIRERQKCVKLSKAGMAPYLVKPEGNLVVLLGPYGEQTEATFPGGANRAISLNELDLPIDGNTSRGGAKQPKGWMFDVGGLVLSLAWAPRVDKTDQVLALCVVPHSDQHHPNTAEKDAYKGSRKHGIIQFWKFSAKKGKFDIMVPKADPAILLRTLMFDWGRARRIKWCPVAPADESLLGLLGVLTGDGKVRVLEIENVKPKERSTFCKCTTTHILHSFHSTLCSRY